MKEKEGNRRIVTVLVSNGGKTITFIFIRKKIIEFNFPCLQFPSPIFLSFNEKWVTSSISFLPLTSIKSGLKFPYKIRFLDQEEVNCFWYLHTYSWTCRFFKYFLWSTKSLLSFLLFHFSNASGFFVSCWQRTSQKHQRQQVNHLKEALGISVLPILMKFLKSEMTSSSNFAAHNLFPIVCIGPVLKPNTHWH